MAQANITRLGALELVDGITVEHTDVATVTGAAVTLTAAQLLGRIIDGSHSAAATFTTPTAVDLIQAMNRPSIGASFEFVLVNTGAGAITPSGGTGVTLVGADAVAGGSTARFLVRVDSMTTVTIYQL